MRPFLCAVLNDFCASDTLIPFLRQLPFFAFSLGQYSYLVLPSLLLLCACLHTGWYVHINYG